MTNSTTETKPLSEQELKEIEQRCEAATPGPWRWAAIEMGGTPADYLSGEDDALFGANGVRILTDGSARGEYGQDIDPKGDDGQFIAHSRTDVRKLLDELRREREANAALRADLRTVGEALGHAEIATSQIVDPSEWPRKQIRDALSLPSVRELMAERKDEKRDV